MGDGVLAYFGYPQAHEHDAERAVLAGLALVEAVPKLSTMAMAGSPLQVRIGIATGLVWRKLIWRPGSPPAAWVRSPRSLHSLSVAARVGGSRNSIE
jgi:hypothetical protein